MLICFRAFTQRDLQGKKRTRKKIDRSRILVNEEMFDDF